MTEIEPVQGAEVVLPHTGEVVDLADVEKVASAIDSIREYKALLDRLRGALEDVVRAESERQGTKTLHYDTLTAVVTGGPKTEYDGAELAQRLRDAGLPEFRVTDAVAEIVSYKPNAAVLKQLAAANAAYAAAIEACRQTRSAPYHVRVDRARR